MRSVSNEKYCRLVPSAFLPADLDGGSDLLGGCACKNNLVKLTNARNKQVPWDYHRNVLS